MFEITYEATAFTSDLKSCEQILDENCARGYTETSLKEGSFPSGVMGVASGYITPDDHQNPADAKMFVSITLLVDVADEAGAQKFPVPVDLLSNVADLIPLLKDGINPLGLDSSTWELTEANEVEPAPRKPAVRP